MRRTSRLVFTRLYLATGDTHQTEDLLQETLLTAYRTLGQLDDPEKFRPWLLRIAMNASIDAVRHDTRKKRTQPSEPERQRGEAPDPADIAEREEMRQKVLEVLRTLPEEYRVPIMLRYLVGADYDAIQQQMGLSNGFLRGLLHRGMERMRAEMQKVLGADYPQT
ncbi:MAG: sigma-70 family RNA polymerase sigma factor [Gemmataceae bacterium]|nr:sigma-70 family RNA polymerase sigma factor [Gemmataceae bacterium]